MDPISIITLVGSATKLSWQIVITLRNAVDEHKKVDENLLGFAREIESVRRVLVSISTSLNDPALGLAEISHAQHANKDMWLAIYGAVEDCNMYLQKLCAEVMPLTKPDGKESVFSQAVRALKLQLNKDDIEKIRSQLQSHQVGLGTSLQMLSVYMSCRLPMQMQDNLGQKIDILGEMLEQLQTSIDEQAKKQVESADNVMTTEQPGPSNPFGDSQAAADSEKSVGDKLASTTSTSTSVRLKEAAKRIYSNASVVSATRSTQWGGSERYSVMGSVMGEPLSDGSRNEIERWIAMRRSETIKQEMVRSPTPTTTDPSSVFSRNDLAMGGSEIIESEQQESDSEDEIDFEVSKKLLDKANKFFNDQKFNEAAGYFERGLKRSKNLRVERRAKLALEQVNLRLARCFLHTSEPERSKALLLKLTSSHPTTAVDSSIVLEATFVLSELYFRILQFDDAEAQCRKALKGRRLVFGRGSSPYNEALFHLVTIYMAKEEPEEAQAVADLLPDGMRDAALDPAKSWNDMTKVEPTKSTNAPEKLEEAISREDRRIREAKLNASLSGLTRDELIGLVDSKGRMRDSSGVPLEDKKKAELRGATASSTSLALPAKPALNLMFPSMPRRPSAFTAPKTAPPALPKTTAAPYNQRLASVRFEDSFKIVHGDAPIQCFSVYEIGAVSRLLSPEVVAKIKAEHGLHVYDYTAAKELLRKAVNTGNFWLIEQVREVININTPLDDQGRTALMHAMLIDIDRDIAGDVITCLVRNGASLNAVDNRGYTALMISIESTFYARPQWLIRMGADLNHQAKDGERACTLAFRLGREEAIPPLYVPFFIKDLSNAQGRTWLHYAALLRENEELGRITRLLSRGIPINQPDDKGTTPLMLALQFGNLHSARVLLDAGARFDARDHRGRNALTIALEEREGPAAHLLLDRLVALPPWFLARLDLDTANEAGRAQTMLAAAFGDAELQRKVAELHRKALGAKAAVDRRGSLAKVTAAAEAEPAKKISFSLADNPLVRTARGIQLRDNPLVRGTRGLFHGGHI